MLEEGEEERHIAAASLQSALAGLSNDYAEKVYSAEERHQA